MSHDTIDYVPPRIGLCADGSIGEGLGHVHRELTLARTLRERFAWNPVFLTRTPEALRALFTRPDEFPVTDMAGRGEDEVCAGLGLELLLCDSKRELDAAYVRTIQNTGCRVWLYGNTGSGNGAADRVIFAFPFVACELVSDYAALRTIESPDNTMMEGRFREIRRTRGRHRAPEAARRILVSMGGSDETFMTGLVIDALSRVKSPIHVDCFIGDLFTREAELDTMLEAAPFRFRVHRASRHLPDIAALADLAVVQFGNIVAELNCLGVPVATINPAKFHDTVAHLYGRDGSTVNLGLAERHTPAGLARELDAIISDKSLREGLSRTGEDKIDGRGVIRVADALFADLQKDFNLYPCDVCGSDEFTVLATIHGRNLVKCTVCGLDYMNVRPTQRLLSDVYGPEYFSAARTQGNAANYEADRENVVRFARARLDVLEQLQGARGRILDIGCALGFYLDEAKRRGWQVSGFDISESAVCYAREKLGLADVRQGSVESVEYPADSFDAIILSLVFEHFLHPRESLARIVTWLKPGGYLVIKVPHAGGVMYRFTPGRWFGTHPDNHFCDYTPRTMGRLLYESGCEPVRWQVEGIYLERFAEALQLSKQQEVAILALDGIRDRYEAFARENFLGDSMVVYARKFT